MTDPIVLLALAQTLPAAQTWPHQILAEAIAVIAPLALAALTALLIAGTRWLAAKAKGTRFENSVVVVEQAVEGAVQRIRTKLEAKFAAVTASDSDGGRVITVAEKQALLADALAALKAELGPGVLAVLRASFGGGLDGWLTSKIEGALLPAMAPKIENPSAP